jgi:hypothetical protein
MRDSSSSTSKTVAKAPKTKPAPVHNASTLEQIIANRAADEESLRQAAASHALSEDLGLALLERRDLPRAVIEDLVKNGRAMKSRKLRNAVVMHIRTPRHLSLPLLRQLFTFELMQVSLTPQVATDIKMAAEDVLVTRMESISSGERLTLARRSSGRVAAALLRDAEIRIVDAALNNPFLTEVGVTKSLLSKETSQLLTLEVAKHEKWSVRKDVRAALLRNPYTPLAQAIIFAQSFSATALQELMAQSKLPENIKKYLLDIAEKSKTRARPHHAG